jgi:DNA-binding MltR family transcriptional regulator
MNIEQFDLFVEDLLGEKLARPIIIVGASKIDDLLYSILSKYLLDPHDRKNDELLKGDNPLATFSSRIKISYRLGIIEINTYKTLEKIRGLRNLCAHRVEFDVNKSPVRDHCSDLKRLLTVRKSYALTKSRFFKNSLSFIEELQCLFITMCVILESIHEKIERTKGNVEILRISNT